MIAAFIGYVGPGWAVISGIVAAILTVGALVSSVRVITSVAKGLVASRRAKLDRDWAAILENRFALFSQPADRCR